jgi:hypothetical protein
MSGDKLKSAYELAMERLQKADRDRGVESSGPLSDAQKREIADLRERAQARVAELEILHRKALDEAGGDPKHAGELDRRYRADRERIDANLESAIARVRAGKPGRLED